MYQTIIQMWKNSWQCYLSLTQYLVLILIIIHTATVRSQTWRTYFSIQLYPNWDTTDAQDLSLIPDMLKSNYVWTSLYVTKCFLLWSCTQMIDYKFPRGSAVFQRGSTSRETRLHSWGVKFGLVSQLKYNF